MLTEKLTFYDIDKEINTFGDIIVFLLTSTIVF